MTAKEAITYLSQLSAGIEWEVDMHYAEAIDMAIEALKAQEVKTDSISRQDAIDAFGLAADIQHAGEKTIRQILSEVPSAQPEQSEPKTGRWIEDDAEMFVRCSECGESNDYISDFCPNCGSYNGGEQDAPDRR